MNGLSRTDIEAAAARIASHVRKTPVQDISLPTPETPVNLKLELFQHTGSFKRTAKFGPAYSRGAFFAKLRAPDGHHCGH